MSFTSMFLKCLYGTHFQELSQNEFIRQYYISMTLVSLQTYFGDKRGDAVEGIQRSNVSALAK